jgi:hypothetical protein
MANNLGVKDLPYPMLSDVRSMVLNHRTTFENFRKINLALGDIYYTSSGRSIYEIVDAIGTTNCATIVVNTPVTLVADLAIPNNVTVQVNQCGYFISSVSSILAILGPFDCYLNHAFRGNELVLFGVDSIDYGRPQWFGSFPLNQIDFPIDQTAGIQRALTAMASYSLFRPLRFSRGYWYVVGLGIGTTYGNGPIPIIGDDDSRTIFNRYDDSDHMIKVENSSPVTGFLFQSFRIGQNIATGPNAGNPSSTYDAIYCTNVVLSYFNEVYANSNNNGISLNTGCVLCWVHKCTFGSLNNIGLKITLSGTRAFHYIEECWFDENFVGGAYVNAWQVGFSNCKWFDNTSYNLKVDSASGEVTTDANCNFGRGDLFPTQSGITSAGDKCTYEGMFDDYATPTNSGGKSIIISAGNQVVVNGKNIYPGQVSDATGKVTVQNAFTKRFSFGSDTAYHAMELEGSLRIKGSEKLLLGGFRGGLVSGYGLNTGSLLTPAYGVPAPSNADPLTIESAGASGLSTSTTYYCISSTASVITRGITDASADTIRPAYDLFLSAIGYTSAIPSDIGKTVTQGASTGTLDSYDNVGRRWTIVSSSVFVAGAVTITSGTGAGTISSVIPSVVPAVNTQVWFRDIFKCQGTGIPPDQALFVVSPTTTTFKVSLTKGGAAINLIGSSSIDYRTAPTFQVSLTVGGAAVAIAADGAISYRIQGDAEASLAADTPGTVLAGKRFASAGGVDDRGTLDASSTTVASLKTAGGLAVAKKSFFGNVLTAKDNIVTETRIIIGPTQRIEAAEDAGRGTLFLRNTTDADQIALKCELGGGATIDIDNSNQFKIRTSSTDRLLVLGTGELKVTNLAGTGSRALQTDSTGVVSALAGTPYTYQARGSVTLVAGVGSVSNASITASSLVRYWVFTPGGTQGFLSYSNNAGVGFSINSTSLTETSVVQYEIAAY